MFSSTKDSSCIHLVGSDSVAQLTLKLPGLVLEHNMSKMRDERGEEGGGEEGRRGGEGEE